MKRFGFLLTLIISLTCMSCNSEKAKFDANLKQTCKSILQISNVSEDVMEELLTMLSDKVKQNGVVGLAYDESDKPHLYRKQKHSVSAWKKLMKKYGFKPTSSQYVFIKE